MSPKPAREKLILGLGIFAHDTGVAFVRDGEILFAAEQERFDRRKHSRAHPVDAVEAGLAFLGLRFADIDDVVVNYDPWRIFWGFARHIWNWLPGSLRMLFDNRRLENAMRIRDYRASFRRRFGEVVDRAFWGHVEHHLAHAASAFYCSPFENAAILSSDALGEFVSVMCARGVGNGIEVLERIPYPHSLGSVYSAVTDHLGFEIYGGEGKVMGLAGYGRLRPELDLSEILRLGEEGAIRLDPRYFRFHVLPWVHDHWVSPTFARRFGPRREPGEPLSDRHADLARALQDLSARVTVHLATHLLTKTGLSHLCYAGGSALNGYGNTRILRDVSMAGLFVQPAANDGGTPLGAALYHCHHRLGVPRRPQPAHCFHGPSFSEKRMEDALIRCGLPFSKPSHLTREVAGRLSRGRVVAWFQGRMELGPRALGHRSILADPRTAAMRDHLNRNVKHRETFRPLAPIVPLNRANEFFAMPCPASPYMLLIVDVRPEWQERLAAISHVDGTTRPQTVSPDLDPLLTDLLWEFEKVAGIPVLLNTSFNGPGEPIVCTPEDAIASFRKHGLDDLVLGPFLIENLGPSRSQHE